MSNRKANKLWIWADLKFSVTLLQMCGAWNLNAASQCLVLTDSKGTLSQTTWEVLDGSLHSSRSDMYINPRPFSALETKNSIWTSILWQTGSQCHYLRTGAAAVFWISCSCLVCFLERPVRCYTSWTHKRIGQVFYSKSSWDKIILVSIYL